MCASHRSNNVGPFPRLLERDYLDGRLRPEVLAAELGVDPSYVCRLRKGDMPVPASILPAIVQHTGNRAYLQVLLDELRLQLLEVDADGEESTELKGLAVRLMMLAPSVMKAVLRWLGAPQKESWEYLQRVIEVAEKVNHIIDTFLLRAKRLAKEKRPKTRKED